MTDQKSETGAAMIWCPFPDLQSARQAANSLLDEHLIACANMLPGITSLFCWDGERSEAEEIGTLLKTNSDLLERAVTRLTDLHPYQNPAVLGWHCDSAPGPVRAWLGAIGQ